MFGVQIVEINSLHIQIICTNYARWSRTLSRGGTATTPFFVKKSRIVCTGIFSRTFRTSSSLTVLVFGAINLRATVAPVTIPPATKRIVVNMEIPNICYVVLKNDGGKLLFGPSVNYNYVSSAAQDFARKGERVTLCKVLPIAEFKPSFMEIVLNDKGKIGY